jgi:hypothetical protein
MGMQYLISKLRKRTLKFRATEILENLFPIWWIVKSTEIRLQFARKNLQCRALADTVCAYQTKHLSRTWHRETMQLETVGRISMGNHGLEVRGQVDDRDGVEWAFLWADTATDAETFRDEGNF